LTGYVNHTSAEDIYQLLKQDILTLELKPGQMISENEIANTYNVSRTPIKTAFMRLKGENYIYIIPQKGTFVTPLDMRYIKDAIYMRSVLETDMLVSIIESGRADEIAALLESNLNQQCTLLDSGEVSHTSFFKLDNIFHQTLFDAMDKRGMWDIIQYSQVYYTRFRMMDSLVTARYRQLYTEHGRIYHAFVQKDKALIKSAVFDHLHSAIEILADKIKTEYSGYFVNKSSDTV